MGKMHIWYFRISYQSAIEQSAAAMGALRVLGPKAPTTTTTGRQPINGSID